MERDDRAPVGTFFTEAVLAAGAQVSLGEGVAHHARVKRLQPGDPVRLTNGAGRRAVGSITAIRRAAVDVSVGAIEDVARPWPIHLRAPSADRDRMLWLAEKSTELGIASWQIVRFRRSQSVSPRGEGAAFAEKVRARMVGALEQSGGAWLPDILPDTTIDGIDLGGAGADRRILLDASGDAVPSAVRLAESTGIVILFGPEGGLEPAELNQLSSQGWVRVRLARTTLRFETAGIAAVATVRALKQSEET